MAEDKGQGKSVYNIQDNLLFIIPVLAALFGVWLGAYLTNKAQSKQIRAKIISENHQKWIDVFVNDISELMISFHCLNQAVQTVTEHDNNPDKLMQDLVKKEADKMYLVSDRLVFLRNKVKISLTKNKANHDDLMKSIDLTLAKMVGVHHTKINHQEINTLIHNFMDKAHSIIMEEKEKLENEILKFK